MAVTTETAIVDKPADADEHDHGHGHHHHWVTQ
jgi:chaperonin GroEL